MNIDRDSALKLIIVGLVKHFRKARDKDFVTGATRADAENSYDESVSEVSGLLENKKIVPAYLNGGARWQEDPIIGIEVIDSGDVSTNTDCLTDVEIDKLLEFVTK